MPKRDYIQQINNLITEKNDPNTTIQRVAEIEAIIDELEKIIEAMK